LFSDVVSGGLLVDDPNSNSNCASIPCVTTNQGFLTTPVEFFSSLVGCLTDLFALPLHKESPAKSHSLINSAVQKHFGLTLPASSLNCIVPGKSSVAVVDNVESALGVTVTSPNPDAGVCSGDEDLGSCLGVDNFKLVSDSDMSGEDGAGSKDWVSVSPGKRRGRRGSKINMLSVASPPTPSPVLGPIRKGHKEKAILASVTETAKKPGRPNTRQRSQK
jgi:hypothetical protein